MINYINYISKAEMGRKLWEELNHLSKTDPEGYKVQMLQRMNEMKDLQTPKKLVSPGLVIKTSGSDLNGISEYWINLAQSTAIKPPPDNDEMNVPILMSELRVSNITKSSMFLLRILK